MVRKLCCITTVDLTQRAFVADAMYQFVEAGFEVTLVCSDTKRLQLERGDIFRYVDMPMKRGISIMDMVKMPWEFYSFFKKEKFDYIQYATPNASLYASIGGWLAKVPVRLYCQWGIRYVGASGFMRIILKALERLTCILSTDICSASRKNLEYAVKEGLYKAGKAAIIGDGGTIGVDLSKYDISKKEEYRNEVIAQYPLLIDKVVFCSVGRLSRDKGSYELLEAFLQIAEVRNDVALMLIGDMEGELPAHLEKVKEHPSIVFTGYTNEVYKYMAACDVLVHPSYREGFSMVIQEAMAMGLAVVTTDIPGPSEVILNGETGILVAPQSTVSLREGMLLMISDKQKMKEMGMNGRMRCEHLFNRKRMLQLTYEHRMRLINK